MAHANILCEVADHVATITLNRPEVRNALNFETFDEINAAFSALQRDSEVRCVILTGTDPAFCSGDDVRQIMVKHAGKPAPDRAHVVRYTLNPTTEAVLDCDRPVIAAVNGAAVGYGMELSLYCDIRIASEHAKFSELFVKRGLIPDVGGLWRLPQLVGHAKAAELMLTGDVIDAREAERIGLVSRVTPHGELMSAARELAGRIAANSPLPLRYIKEGMRRARTATVHELGAFCYEAWGALRQTEDHQEGIDSFIEKRAPVFKGR